MLPILIGLGVVAFMFIRQFDAGEFNAIDWAWTTVLWLGIAIVLMVIRHFVLMWRIKVLTGHKLGWRQSFDIITLWEFASAVTPSTTGGTAIALYLLHKERIKAGETITLILFITFLDGIFFIIGLPFLWLFLGQDLLSPDFTIAGVSGQSVLFYFFILGYAFIFFYTLAIGYGLFVNSQSLKWLLVKVTTFFHRLTQLSFFGRWKNKAENLGGDIETASQGIKTKGLNYWMIGFFTSSSAWILRFLVINVIVVSLIAVSDHLLLFGRQFIIYILTILSPTPGGAGVAEGSFQAFLTDFFPVAPETGNTDTNESLLAITAFLWRSISYFSYLFLGAVVLPRWIKRVFGKKKPLSSENASIEVS